MSDLEQLEQTILGDIAAATDEQAIEAVRVASLGKKGTISEKLKTLGSMSPEERQAQGPAINGLKNRVTEALTERKTELRKQAIAARLEREKVDVTLPVRESAASRGRIHPISQVIDEITAIFADMVITIPYSSPVYIASKFNIPSVFFDPTQQVLSNLEDAENIYFAAGKHQLQDRMLKTINTKLNTSYQLT